MPYLGVSQRPVVAKRLQGSRTDTKLLADILIVHPAAEPSFLSLPRISFTRSEKWLNFPTISSNTSFEIITNSFIAYTVLLLVILFVCKVKPIPVSDNGFTTDWQLVAASGRDWLNSIFRNSPSGCRLYKESQLRQITTNPQHRGSIWRWYGSLWHISDTVYCKMISNQVPENILILVLSGRIRPLNMKQLFLPLWQIGELSTTNHS